MPTLNTKYINKRDTLQKKMVVKSNNTKNVTDNHDRTRRHTILMEYIRSSNIFWIWTIQLEWHLSLDLPIKLEFVISSG